MNIIFLFLFAPSNPQSFNALSFFSQCMFVAFALGVVFLASRLVWPVSDARQTTGRRQGDEGNIGGVGDRQEIQPAGAEHRAWPPGLPTMLPRPLTNIDRIRKCLRAFSRPTTCRSRRLRPTLAWSRAQTIRPSVPRLGPLQRALQSGNSRRLYAGARSILRRMQEGKTGLQEALLGAVTDLWSAGLVLERERRRIRHFAGRGFITRGEGR